MTLASPLPAFAQPGETVDALVWRVLRKGAGAVEAVLAANPGLAGIGLILPAGTEVLLPVQADAPVVRDMIQLWS